MKDLYEALKTLESYGLLRARRGRLDNGAIRDALDGKAPKGGKGGKRHSNAALTDPQIKKLRKLRDEGWSFSELADKFNIALSTAHRNYKK